MSTQETSQNPSYLRALADRLKASWQEQSAKPINQSLADALKGTLRGVTADFLGAPADMATAYLAPPESGNPYANAIRGLFGGGATPVGGSDWWAGKMNLPEGRGLAYEAGRMLTPNPLELARLAKSAGPTMRELITYHGTPHTFLPTERNPLGEFDLSKIGSGEGAQAYGHGIYLAEAPGVAGDYRFNLTKNLKDRVTIDGAPISIDTMKGRAIEDVGLLGKEAALLKIDDNIRFNEKYAPDMAGMYKSLRKEIEGIDPKSVNVNTGNLYTVDLPDEHIANMLDWDKPLSEQPRNAQQALRDMWAKARKSFEQLDPNGNPTAGQVYHIYSQHRSGNAPAVSEELLQAGIPGIKYLDQASRGAGEGTRNFVLFNPDLATILRRE